MNETKHWLEIEKTYQALRTQLEDIWKSHEFDSKLAQLQDLEHLMQQEGFWDDPENARRISQQKTAIEKQLEPWLKIRQSIEDFPTLIELVKEEASEENQKLLLEELQQLQSTIEQKLISLGLMGEDDHRNAIVTIVPGAGGTESQDWAEMLFRMYQRWSSKHGYEIEIMDYQPGEEAGIKSVTFLVKGENAFGYLKCENGVHRLVRQSPFNANNKRHTSFAAVHVAPEIDDSVQVEINEKDLRIDTYRSSGAGGQHVNKTESAVRIVHIPTGIVVQCQNERSQHRNKEMAMKLLRSKLYELEKQKKKEEIESKAGEKNDVSWGNQIRSYVFFPYKLVKDLRTDYETSDVESVMDGEIDEFLKEYLKILAKEASKT
ncbi:MAG: peptide chain release factor 2 [Leptospiraceae bacterium]|nr:peptide chain release factor 2 [Leptospiraceae bacterium]MDW7977027.1 peptide chain release factor 2 [Leptospiraceae bacterium]